MGVGYGDWWYGQYGLSEPPADAGPRRTNLTLVTPPASEPVALSDAKLHLRVDIDDEDSLISGMVASARELVERWTGRALLTQTWKWTADSFPWYYKPIVLGRAPLIAVSQIQYYDTSGVLQTLASNQYNADPLSRAGEIWPAFGVQWPYTNLQSNAVTVTFTAGYADTPTVPSSLKSAILLTLGDLYENRESSMPSGIVENPAVQRLIDPYRLSLT